MPESLQVIEQRLRDENPVVRVAKTQPGRGNIVYLLKPDTTPLEYEEWIQERARLVVKSQVREEEEQILTAKRVQFSNGMAKIQSNYDLLRGTGALTNVQLRTMLGDTHQAILWLGDILQDLHLIERGED